jgi:hypothetical protein
MSKFVIAPVLNGVKKRRGGIFPDSTDPSVRCRPIDDYAPPRPVPVLVPLKHTSSGLPPFKEDWRPTDIGRRRR